MASGPAPCRVIAIGAGPGKIENQTGIPYSGLAGDELIDTYLPIAGLRSQDVHIGNATLCFDGTDRTPSDARVAACAAHHLPALLDKVKPEVVVLMGGTTHKIADQRVRLDMHHGYPQRNSVLGKTWEGWVVPMYEPALGMRETPRMTSLIDDFRHLGQWLRGEWEPPTADLMMQQCYRLIEDPKELKYYLRLNGRPLGPGLTYPPLAMDTETHGGKPWSVQFSHTPHTGCMIQAEGMVQECLLEQLNWWLQDTRTEVILHNSPGDLDTLDKMGIRPVSFVDTMQGAYNQCSLPQGLKPLAYRLLGVTMRSWEDVVRPASVRAVVDWMEDAMALAATNLSDCTVRKLKKGDKVVLKSGVVENIMRHVLTYTAKTEDADTPYDPWEALERMRTEGLRGKVAEAWEWEWLEEMIGPTPILGIGNCDLQSACDYAISDADHTLQVAAELDRLRGDKRWQIDAGDRDV